MIIRSGTERLGELLPACKLICALALLLLLAQFAAATCVFEALFLFRCFGNHGWNGNSTPAAVDSDKGEVRRGDVPSSAGDVVLNPAFHSDFHRGMKSAI